MTVPFDISVPGIYDVTVDAYGDIQVSVAGGYYGENVDREFTIAELRTILDFAELQHRAYKAYADGGYEDEATYFEAMEGFRSEQNLRGAKV